jgi:zinc transport system substrate-binding protein
MILRILGLAAILLGGGALAPAQAEPPTVVASIKPIQSLVAGVMQGAGVPQLLIKGLASPHAYSLRPSEARALSEADLVFWVGPELETFMVKPLAALAAEVKAVALAMAPGVERLPTRAGGMWEADADDAHDAAHLRSDMHVWLDPRNAEAMVDAIVGALSSAAPERAATWRANGARLRSELDQLDRGLEARLAPVRDRPFVVFHDGYQYFEHRYRLNAVGAITVDPERRPGAQRLRAIQARLGALEAACVFAEPQFEPALVDTLLEGTKARKGVLDPLGAALDAGPDQYFQLLDGLAASLVDCLVGPGSG